jgi:AcrR family transcriptional regulator
MTLDTSNGASHTPLRHTPRRQALLLAITDCMAETGLVNLSLREIARRIDISPPALIHHFGNKEKLLREALGAIHERDVALIHSAFACGSVTSALQALWRVHSRPAERRRQGAALEIQSIVQNDPGRFPNYHQHLTRPWIAAMHSALERAGCPKRERIALATLLMASYRGLINDLLATGESRRIQAAFDLLLDSTREMERSWGQTPASL